MEEFNLICCVVNMGDASKVLKIAKKYGVKNGIISIGKGTVHSRFLEFLKINEIRKEFVIMLIEKELAAEAIKGISKDMAFEKPHHGIAFSYSVSKLTLGTNDDNKNTKINEVKNSMYKAIYVIVDKGKAEDVIDAANKAGARGGTILNARGSGVNDTQKLFSIEIEPEKEKVFIITKSELKDSIIESIKSRLDIDKTNNGIIFVLDINEAYGLH
jgi:Nitrogen regulatory protein PII